MYIYICFSAVLFLHVGQFVVATLGVINTKQSMFNITVLSSCVTLIKFQCKHVNIYIYISHQSCSNM